MIKMGTPASVSVIIPCYCCADFLRLAVDSVFTQSILPMELILVDDASPDDLRTRRCIEEIISLHPVSLPISIRAIYLEKNLGPSGARNAGWEVAVGRYVAFLDADDAWNKDKIGIQYGWMIEHSQYLLSCHGVLVTEGLFPQINLPLRYANIELMSLLLSNKIATSSVMIQNQPNFRFPQDFRYAEDYYLWLSLIIIGHRLAFLDINLVKEAEITRSNARQSGDLKLMHRGVMSCFQMLWRDGHIAVGNYWCATFWETLKYLYRKINKIIG